MDKGPAFIEAICEHLARGEEEKPRRVIQDVWPFIPEPRNKKKVPPSRALEVFIRDSFTCRYCGERTVLPAAMHLVSYVLPDDFPFHPHWQTDACHPAYWLLPAVCDHVKPAGRGGGIELDNLVTACQMCNNKKSVLTLDELGWKIKEKENTQWDGLCGLFVSIFEKYRPDNEKIHSTYNNLKTKKYPAHIWEGR
jgi:5-methylcytosine-specific restriction endonuclease McrA